MLKATLSETIQRVRALRASSRPSTDYCISKSNVAPRTRQDHREASLGFDAVALINERAIAQLLSSLRLNYSSCRKKIEATEYNCRITLPTR